MNDAKVSITLDHTLTYYNALGQAFTNQISHVNGLKIGNLNFKNIQGYEYQDFSTSFSVNESELGNSKIETDTLIIDQLARNGFKLTDGLLGYKLFRDFICVLNYPEHLLVLIQSDTTSKVASYIAAKEGYTKVKSDFTKEGIFVYFKVEGVQYKFCLDTGCTSCLIRKTSKIHRIVKNIGNLDDMQILNLNSGIYNCATSAYWVDNFKFPKCDGILGFNFFNTNKLLIDFNNRSVYIKTVQ